jgi:putative ABC transport system substrate-binding protein
VPIAFYVGTDPVTVGLVESYSKPGGRFTGVHGHATDLTAKRLQMMRDMLPRMRRVVICSPENEARSAIA